jgi:hypothetical protein
LTIPAALQVENLRLLGCREAAWLSCVQLDVLLSLLSAELQLQLTEL